MIVNRWNAKTQEYEPCEVPKEWKVTCFETDMRKMVSCAGCGEVLPYGKTFTSRLLHTKGGAGYAVCGRCHSYEIKGGLR